MKDKLAKIFNIFKHRCPMCNGLMEMKYLDMELNKVVYVCTKCENEYI